MYVLFTLIMLALSVWVVFSAVLAAATMTFNKSVQGLVSVSENVNLSDTSGASANPTVLAAQPGVLTTHTTNSTGTLTMTNANHGIATGQRFDLYWAAGHCYGCVAGTVSGTTVPIASVSGGANLPASSTAVTVGIVASAPLAFAGDNLTALVFSTSVSGYFVLNDGASDVTAQYVTGGRVGGWKTGDVATNPAAGGTPTKVYMSHTQTSGPVSTMIAAALSH